MPGIILRHVCEYPNMGSSRRANGIKGWDGGSNGSFRYTYSLFANIPYHIGSISSIQSSGVLGPSYVNIFIGELDRNFSAR